MTDPVEQAFLAHIEAIREAEFRDACKAQYRSLIEMEAIVWRRDDLRKELAELANDPHAYYEKYSPKK